MVLDHGPTRQTCHANVVRTARESADRLVGLSRFSGPCELGQPSRNERSYVPAPRHRSHVADDDASDYSSKSQADRGKSLRAIVKKYMSEHATNARADEITYIRLQQEVSLSEYEKNEYARQMRLLKPLKIKNRHTLEQLRRSIER